MLACRQLAWHWSLQVTPTLMHNYNQCPAGILYQAIYISTLTPSLPQPVNFPGSKKYGRACKQYIFRFYNTSIFSAICFDEDHFTYQSEKESERAEGFQISYFYWSFSSDTMAVNGLIPLLLQFTDSVLDSSLYLYLSVPKRAISSPFSPPS